MSGLDVAHLDRSGVRKFGLASSTFMCPGIRPATDGMANFTVMPRFLSWS